MQKSDDMQFAKLMGILAEVYDDDKKLSKLKIEIYFNTLKEYPMDAISQAVSSLVKNRVFPSFPKPAEIIKEIEGEGNQRALEAWYQVDSAVQHVGRYTSVRFADQVIHSTVQVMGGWIKLCECTNDEFIWKQKEFERLYPIMVKRGNHPQYLIGVCERDNFANGIDYAPDVARIGFDEAPKLITAKGQGNA